jgi:ATPase subunit of ABC transporter with duplicated ATPase domains
MADLEDIIAAHDGYTLEARASEVLEGLGIPTRQHRAPLSTLSGGFKLRVLLAQVLVGGVDVLLLDEPTNHLDLDSREALEESLEDFPGSIVFVSHDRAFIDRLATRVVDLREGRALMLPGNYTETADARAERRRRPEPAVTRPAPASPSAPAPAAPPKRKRVSERSPESSAGKEAARRRRRIAALEEKISACEAQIESIETRLWEEALTLSSVAAHELSKEKTTRKAELDALMEEWARLSEEAEQAAHEAP